MIKMHINDFLKDINCSYNEFNKILELNNIQICLNTIKYYNVYFETSFYETTNGLSLWDSLENLYKTILLNINLPNEQELIDLINKNKDLS